MSDGLLEICKNIAVGAVVIGGLRRERRQVGKVAGIGLHRGGHEGGGAHKEKRSKMRVFGVAMAKISTAASAIPEQSVNLENSH
ncbi:hypothetical protein VNO78_11614 [Psophocarpus tetragonolobus]|uniref:Uncharacterized protein n=1 Tax=Psophocarpus tetragonolobus TaxID=3891 RepID=A0AAN9SUJ9_PSOTE